MERNIVFNGTSARDLDGQGLVFKDGSSTKHLVIREGNLWSNTNVNLNSGLAIMFNNTVALKQNELGSTVVKSNLREVGTLKSLNVSGKTSLGQVMTVDPDFSRVGIGTDSPNAGLSVVDNGVEIIVGSFKNDTAAIGTYTSDDLSLVTDNTERLTISRSGEIVVGHPKHKNGVFRVHGKIIADVVETAIKNNDSIEIHAPEWHTEPYDRGIVWGGSTKRSLTFKIDPDRFLSTEIFDLAAEKYFAVDGSMVLSKTSLGSTVTESNLTTLGTLRELNVQGKVSFETAKSILEFDDGLSLIGKENTVSLTENGFRANKKFNIEVDRESEFEIDSEGNIVLGNRHNTNRVVSVFGQLSVGVRRPDPSISFTVAGAMSFAGRKFITGDTIPTVGQFTKGDICWNTDPKTSDYVGWVCVMSGTPGQWEPFGAIGK